MFALIEAGVHPDRWREQWAQIAGGRTCRLVRSLAVGAEARQAAAALAEGGLLLLRPPEPLPAAESAEPVEGSAPEPSAVVVAPDPLQRYEAYGDPEAAAARAMVLECAGTRR